MFLKEIQNLPRNINRKASQNYMHTISYIILLFLKLQIHTSKKRAMRTVYAIFVSFMIMIKYVPSICVTVCVCHTGRLSLGHQLESDI